jgi:molecular chaperone HtpG
VSLAEYVSRARPGQDAIFYVTADSLSTAKNSPHLEVFRKTGVEVLLQSAAQGSLDVGRLGDAASTVAEELKEHEYQDLLARVGEVLKDRASGVRLTKRLTDSPACLVAGADGISRRLERILRESGQPLPASRPVLEINPDHPVVQRLKQESDAALFTDWSHILFDQALLAEGGELEDPATFVKRLNSLTLALAGGGASRIWLPGR